MDAVEKIKLVKSKVNPFTVYEKIQEMDLALKRKPGQVPDPRTGEGNTVFRINTRGDCYLNGRGYMDVIDVVSYIYNISKMAAVDKVVELYFGKNWDRSVTDTPSNVVTTKKNYDLSEEEILKRRNSLNVVWSRSVPITESKEALTYLKARGLNINCLPKTLRGIGSTIYYENVDGKLVKSWWPALLGMYFDSKGKPLTLHRIFLNKSGDKKAPVECPKKIMAPPHDMRGGAIRLDEPRIFKDQLGEHGILALAEGIETALAVRQCTRLPTWACYSNTLLEQVVIPKGINRVIIYADKDAKGAGQESAYKLQHRLRSQDIEADVLLPPMNLVEGQKSIDWLDVLVSGQIDSFKWRAEGALNVFAA